MLRFALVGAFLLSVCAPGDGLDDFSAEQLAKYPPANPVEPHRALVLSEIGALKDGGWWLECFVRGARGASLEEWSVVRLGAEGRRRWTLPASNLGTGKIFLVYLPAGEETPVIDDAAADPRRAAHAGAVLLQHGFRDVEGVRFGAGTPELDCFAGRLPALPPGKSLGKDWTRLEAADADAWSLGTPTPGLPNDVRGTLDADGDGIPDANEVAGATFAGLPLHAWGARPGVPDLFMQIDTMDSESFGIQPFEASLALVRRSFARRGIAVHFDVGNLFHGEERAAAGRFDLRGKAALRPELGLVAMTGSRRFAGLDTFRAAWLEAPRHLAFYYGLFVQAVSTEAGRYEGIAGMGTIGEPKAIIALGASMRVWGNVAVNGQALTLMHEMGHNLGLRHGGFEDRNYKPNYYSIVNYLYSGWGLPSIGSTNEGDRYLLYNRPGRYSNQPVWVEGGPSLDPEAFSPRLDFSDGRGLALDEVHLDERAGLGRKHSAWVDWNGDGRTNADLALDLNPRALPASNAERLRDWDDWGNLRYYYAERWRGWTRPGAPPQTLFPAARLGPVGEAIWLPGTPGAR
ncbi:MAG: hypothetical protein J0L75_16795 [Spirochaetes bacterium]|nr:hypothetical protein [Spirochaetota bacterium]